MTARTTFKSIAITLAVCGTALAPTAFAAPADNVSVEIDTRYLETDWGVEKIYDKLASKAENACVSDSLRTLSTPQAERDCMTDLLDDFIQSADHDRLTSYHARMTS